MKNTHKVVNSSGSPVTDSMPKSMAYRHCKMLNGKKAGGTKPYKVQRINL